MPTVALADTAGSPTASSASSSESASSDSASSDSSSASSESSSASSDSADTAGTDTGSDTESADSGSDALATYSDALDTDEPPDDFTGLNKGDSDSQADEDDSRSEGDDVTDGYSSGPSVADDTSEAEPVAPPDAEDDERGEDSTEPDGTDEGSSLGSAGNLAGSVAPETTSSTTLRSDSPDPAANSRDSEDLEDEVDPPTPLVVPDVDEPVTAPEAPQHEGSGESAIMLASPADDYPVANSTEQPTSRQVMVAASPMPTPTGFVAKVASWLGWSPGGGPDVPALAPFTWAAAAFARREIDGLLSSGDQPTVTPMALSTLESCGASLECHALADLEGDITGAITNYVAGLDPLFATVAPLFGAAGFTVLSAGVLGNFETVPAVVQSLATDDEILGLISALVADSTPLSPLPADLRVTVGNTVAHFVEQTFGNQAVAAALVPVFESIPFPTDTEAVVEYLYDLVEEDFDFEKALVDLVGSPERDALSSFFADSDVQQVIRDATSDSLQVLLGTVTPPWATETNPPALAAYVGQMIATSLLGEDNPGAAGLGATISGTVNTLLSAVGIELADAVDTAVVIFLDQPGISDGLATAALNSILAGLGGRPLSAGETFEPAVGAALSSAVNLLLSDADVLQAFGSAASDLVTDLVENTSVHDLVEAQVAASVAAILGDTPIAAPVGHAVGAAVRELMATPGIGAELAAVVGPVLPDFLGHTAVAPILISATNRLAEEILGGDEPTTVLIRVLNTLRDDTAIQAALKATVASTLNGVDVELLGQAAVQQALGNALTALVADLSANHTVLAYVGAELDFPFGGALVAALAEPAVGQNLAETLGLSVDDFLAYPGFAAALTDAAGKAADDVLTGADLSTALQSAWRSLESDASVHAAVASIIPGVVQSVLGAAPVRMAFGTAAADVAVDYLEGSVFDNTFVDGVVSQFASATVESLLGAPAVMGIVSGLSEDVLNGMSLTDVPAVVLQAITTQVDLQIAVGMSLGRGMGSVFGDNVVGDAIGAVAGFNATIVVFLAAGAVQLYEWLSGEARLGFNAGTGRYELAEPYSGIRLVNICSVALALECQDGVDSSVAR